MKKIFLLAAFLAVASLLPAQRVVDVKDEPRHHLIFENDYIRLLDVHLGPADTTLYHRHHTPSVFILLSTTKTGSQLLSGLPMGGANTAGEVIFDSLNHERIHRVWNIDTVWMHVIDAEVKAKQPKQPLSVIESKNLNLLFKEGMLNGYKLRLANEETFQSPNSVAGYLIVSLTDSKVMIEVNGDKEIYWMKPGHFSWIGPNKKFILKNLDNSEAQYAILQF